MTIFKNIQQDVVPSTGNSSTANLNSGASFTGTGEATLNVAAIQFMFKADQLCTIQVQQSLDNTNWDLSDSFIAYPAIGIGQTVQCVGSYFRIVVTNNGPSATTYLRLSSVQCPMVEAVPRALSSIGNLKTAIQELRDYRNNVNTFVSAVGNLGVYEHVKLVGLAAVGTTLDTNFWQTTVANGGTNTVGGGAFSVACSTDSASSAQLISGVDGAGTAGISRARYMAGTPNKFRTILRTTNAGLASNTKMWGAYDGTDGFYFKLNGTGFEVGYSKSGSPTAVTSGNFNGEYGSTYTMDTNVHTYEIWMSNTTTYWLIDAKVLHSVSANSATISGTMSLPIYLNNTNAGATTATTLEVRVASILRLGNFTSAPRYYNISTSSTFVLKYSPGHLFRVIINAGSVNGTVTLYDNTTATAPTIATVAAGTAAVGSVLEYNCSFNNGLTVVTANAPNITLVYE